MYDPDANRYDSWLGDVPMMRPERTMPDFAPVPKLMLSDGMTMRCFAPCHDQLAGRPCPCTERIKHEVAVEMFEQAREQLANKHSGNPTDCPYAIGKPSWCETCDVKRPPSVPKRGQIEAFDAGWDAHARGMSRQIVATVMQRDAVGWGVLAWDCRNQLVSNLE